MSVEPHQQIPLSPRPYFDDNNERYRFCCCHVRIWTIVIGILGIIFAVLSIGPFLHYTKTDESQPTYDSSSLGILVGGIISNGLEIAACIILLIGVRKENRFLLIPYLVWGVITVIFAVAMAVRCFIVGIVFAAADGVGWLTAILVAVGAACLIDGGIKAFFLYPVFRCYKYFAEKASAYVPMSTAYPAVDKGYM